MIPIPSQVSRRRNGTCDFLTNDKSDAVSSLGDLHRPKETTIYTFIQRIAMMLQMNLKQ